MDRPTGKIFKNLKGPLSQKQAEEIYALGAEAVIWALITLSAMAAGKRKPKENPADKAGNEDTAGATPSTPSGMVPPYQKKNKRKRRKKPGHPGCGRPKPEITDTIEHPPLDSCPDCGSNLPEPSETTTRIIEDIIKAQPQATEHHIPRHWCATCKKFVSPPVADAMPGATFGHRLITLTAWLHYGLGVTISQIVSVLQYQLQFKLSEGGLVNAWQRLGEILYPWYEQIGDEVRAAGVLHADETGW